MEFKQNYDDKLNKGSWHDHKDNWNWKAWCWIMSANGRYSSFSNQIFKESNFKDEKKYNWEVVKELINSGDCGYGTMSSGEKVLCDLASYLYSDGKMTFAMSDLSRLDENLYEVAINAIHIAAGKKVE